MREKCDLPGMGTLRGTNLIGFDPSDGNIHWYTVDNFGTTHEHIGNFEDARHFKMMHKSMQNGKEYVEKISLNLESKNKLDLYLMATLDGQTQEILEAVFIRKSEISRLDSTDN